MDDNDLLRLIQDKHLSDNEIKNLLKQLSCPPQEHKQQKLDLGVQYKFGVVSDLHAGSKYFREDVLLDSIKVFNREKVDAILLPGDIIEGMSNRDGHIYELSKIGVTEQLNYAVDLLNQYSQPIFGIQGNHDLWSMNKANQGVNIGGELESRVKNYTNLGDMRGEIDVNGVTIRLTHEGNTAYALSYSGQKIINSLSGGTKPNIILNGHLHKSLYMLYRNIHFVECGTLQSQTPFMQMKGSPAMLSYWVLKIRANSKGVSNFTPTLYPYYD